MNSQDNQRVSNRPPHYNLWVGVFIIFALITTGLFYYATQKIEYNWRWSRVPIYFAYEDTIEIVSEIEGDVASITQKGEDAVVTVKGIDGSASGFSFFTLLQLRASSLSSTTYTQWVLRGFALATQ